MAGNPWTDIGGAVPPGQPKKRRYAYFEDQHGRKWGGVIEIKTGGFVSIPEAHFDAPLVPPAEFVRQPRDSFNHVEIDYEGWLGDILKAKEEWLSMLQQAAMHLGAQGQISSLVQNPTPEVLYLTGPPPENRDGYVDPIVIQACLAGNRWVLYGEGPMPPAAKPYFKDRKTQKRGRRLTTKVPAVDPFATDGSNKPVVPFGEDDSHVPVEEDDETSTRPGEVWGPADYELVMTSPGRWQMPDGRHIKGTREDALEALSGAWPNHHTAVLEAAEE